LTEGQVTRLHPAALPVEELLKQCQIRNTRRSGPGGQHRNKVETAVVIQHLTSGITAQASERRSQQMNRLVAIHRLRLALAVEFRNGSPILSDGANTLGKNLNESPANINISDLWRSRNNRGRISVAAGHSDYPAILAEMLDLLNQLDWELGAAATSLHTSSSQLAKLLRSHAPAMQLVNQQRLQRGFGPLV
jgi:RF-1 domain